MQIKTLTTTFKMKLCLSTLLTPLVAYTPAAFGVPANDTPDSKTRKKSVLR